MESKSGGLEQPPHLTMGSYENLKVFLYRALFENDLENGKSRDADDRDKQITALFDKYWEGSLALPFNQNSTLYRAGLYGIAIGVVNKHPESRAALLGQAREREVFDDMDATMIEEFYTYAGGLHAQLNPKDTAEIQQKVADRLKHLHELADFQAEMYADCGQPAENVKLALIMIAAGITGREDESVGHLTDALAFTS